MHAAAIGVAVGINLRYWVAFFTSDSARTSDDPAWLDFENTFVLADGYMDVLGRAATVQLWRGHPSAVASGIAAGSAVTFLGGVSDPFPWDDLWRWYAQWSQHLGTYAARRAHIAELMSPARERLEQLIQGRGVDDAGPADDSTWPGLERRLQDAKARLDLASALDDWQDVG